MNRLGDLSDLPSNPTGLKVTGGILLVVFITTVLGILEYRHIAKGAEATDNGDQLERKHKQRHEKNVSHFALYKRHYTDKDVEWSKRAVIGLRTRWLLGGCL